MDGDCALVLAIGFSVLVIICTMGLGSVRFLFVGISLSGFVLIGWAASFTCIDMQRLWRPAA